MLLTETPWSKGAGVLRRRPPPVKLLSRCPAVARFSLPSLAQPLILRNAVSVARSSITRPRTGAKLSLRCLPTFVAAELPESFK
jgi:hypothetical protein